MAANFSWVVPGVLAGCAFPHGVEALDALAREGVGAIVNLAEEPLDADVLRAHGLVCVHLPLADFSAPDQELLEAATSTIARFRGDGVAVTVNCGAGLGRTGTVLAAYLVRDGLGADEAIARVRAARPGSIETAEQEAAVHAYASRDPSAR